MARIPNKDRISSVQQMPKLRPSSMWPRRHATVANALATLAQIDFVEFAHTKKVHGTQVFVLNVYLKRKPNRIPTNRSSRNESIAWTDRNKRNTLTPDYQLEKTLSDLQTLRYYSYDYAQQRSNDFAACEYCAAFYALTHKHYSNAKLLALLWPSAAHRKTVIEGFVNGMVALSVDGLSSLQRTRGCSSFANIPVRIQRFLSQRQRGYGSF